MVLAIRLMAFGLGRGAYASGGPLSFLGVRLRTILTTLRLDSLLTTVRRVPPTSV